MGLTISENRGSAATFFYMMHVGALEEQKVTQMFTVVAKLSLTNKKFD